MNKLRVETEKRNNGNYSYDSPLLERIKEEEEVKAINVFKQNNLGHSQSLKRMESPPIKSKTLRLDLFSSNILVIFVVLTKKNYKFKENSGNLKYKQGQDEIQEFNGAGIPPPKNAFSEKVKK